MYLFAMRVILVTCIVYILLNIVIGDDESFKISPRIIQSYPKQVKKYKGLEVKFLNRRYMKNRRTEDAPLRTKKHTENSYTVFPMHDDKNNANMNIPDSPYFPFDKHIDDKSSVKKESISRKKRSADEKSDDDIQVKKTESVTVPQSTTAQQSSTSQPQQSSTSQTQQRSATKQLAVKESTTVRANTPVASVKEEKVPKAGENPTRRLQGKRGANKPRSKTKKRQKDNGVVKNVKKVANKERKRTGTDGNKRTSKRVAQPKSPIKTTKTKRLGKL